MVRKSAGLIMYIYKNSDLKIFLVHPGGPYFKKKDEGSWSIPKGIIEDKEDTLDTAIREFEEETGLKPTGDFFPLGEITMKSGKIIYAWAFEGKEDGEFLFKSNLFEMEWPPKSGKKVNFPEADKFEFFSIDEAKKKINAAQIPLIDNLINHLKTKKTNLL
ncbi:MAG TPA: NUDIX domain-containing protein [Ignavibacteriaceae bacterium]|nr:NUDIX domain-containing protein [Ignavibacteriaceae bacterium]